MNTYLISAIASAWSGMTVMNLSTDNQARHLAAILFAIAVMLVVIGVVVNVRRSMAVQWAPIPPEQGTADRPVRAPRTPIESEASTSPTPSYGAAEISPISELSADKPLAGKRISVTGKLPYKREYVEDFIVAMGGTVSRTVTRKTDFLVDNDECYRRVGESIKHAKACDLNIPIIKWESLLELCNLPKDYNIFNSESQDYWRTRHQKRTSVELNRAYGKEYERMAGLLKEILCGNFLGKVSCEIKKDLIKPVSVVVKCDEDDQEDIEVLRVCRYEVSPSPNPRYDGDFLFFDERGNECDFKNLTVDSIARLLSVYGR